MLQFALSAAERGLAVFPCRPQSKEPAIKNWPELATRDQDVIRRWWADRPNCNIGAACGPKSNVFVIDADAGGGPELAELERDHGALPATIETITPRGPGRHLFFRYTAEVKNSAKKIAPHIDVRGDGGFVVLAPSVHPNGRRYHWAVDCAERAADAPQWLLDLITAQGDAIASPAVAMRARRDLVTNGVREGSRDCSVTKLAGHLIRRGVDPIVALELLQCWNTARCVPPLPESDIERIVNSICGRELRRRAS
jgi:hypothetical protein